MRSTATPGLRVPEFIELFANKSLKSLTRHFLANPQQFAWLLAFQRDQMQVGLTEAQKAHYTQFLGPIIDNNFRQRPSAGPAFAQMTYQYSDEIAANTARLADFRRSDVPLLLIWGKSDPYLHVTVAEYMRSQARNGAIHVLKRGIGPRSTSLLMSLGLCLRAGDCENAWQVGLACPSARETPKAGKFSGPARARKISLRAFSFSGQTELPSCPSIARIKLSHSGRLLIQPRAAVSDARTLRARVRIASGGFLFTNRLSAVAL